MSRFPCCPEARPETHSPRSAPDKDYTTHRVLIGTHTEGGAPNYLQIATVTLPTRKPPKAEDYDEETGEIGGYGRSKGKAPTSNTKFSIVQKIDHPGEVNKVNVAFVEKLNVANSIAGSVFTEESKHHSDTLHGWNSSNMGPH